MILDTTTCAMSDGVYEWRRAVGSAPCSVHRGPFSEPQHLVRGRWKQWRAECWKKYGTNVAPKLDAAIAGLRVAGAGIWLDGKPLACLEDHLVACRIATTYAGGDKHWLLRDALRPLFAAMTVPDRLLYCGGDSFKENALFYIYSGLCVETWYGWLLSSRRFERNGRRRFIDPHGVPPVRVRGFVHFMLLVGERVDVLVPEIWFLILSFCTVDELCFKFVPRVREPCGHCGKPALLRCVRCKAVRYCDERCQRAAYRVHACVRPLFPK